MDSNFLKIITVLSLLIVFSWIGFFYYVNQNGKIIDNVKEDITPLDIYVSDPSCSTSFTLPEIPSSSPTTPTNTTPLSCSNIMSLIGKPNGTYSTNLQDLQREDKIYYACGGTKNETYYANFVQKLNGIEIYRQREVKLSNANNQIFKNAGLKTDDSSEYYWSYQIPANAGAGEYSVECEVCSSASSCTGMSN